MSPASQGSIDSHWSRVKVVVCDSGPVEEDFEDKMTREERSVLGC